jgi:hypothetical protein
MNPIPDKPRASRRYPAFWEKGVPILLIIIGVAVVILIAIIFVVVIGLAV